MRTVVKPESLPNPPCTVRIRPVLSPDNYVDQVTKLVKSAKRRLYLQYAYITYSKAAHDGPFRELLDYIADLTHQDDMDVRIIVGSATAQEKVPKLVENGYNEARIRVQSNIHNKAIVVDGEIALVSSANWSGDGVLRNRDAGLIIYDEQIAQYYERVFLDDWNVRARQSIGGPPVRIALADEATPPGMVRMTWDDYFGE